jgi:hypothetical protein
MALMGDYSRMCREGNHQPLGGGGFLNKATPVSNG